mgnify:CR=1 FL=1
MNLFNTAILVTAAAAVVLLVKLAFGNRITPRGHMLMWILVAASVLAAPLAGILPESDFSAKTYLPQSRNTTETVWVEPYENLDARGFGIEEQGNYYTVQKDHVSMQVPFTGRTVDSDFTATVSRAKIENYVWIAGAAAVLLLMLAGTMKQKRRLKVLPCMDDANAHAELDELKKLVGIRDNTKIQIRSGADSTFLTFMGGQYVIALENGFSEEEQRQVLAHELTHLAHGDLIYNLISAFFLAAFWWNPVIWLAFRRFRRDMEVYCDYDAARKTGDKKGYAETLVRAAAGTERFILGTTSFIGGEKEISARVKALAAFKKPKTWIAVLAALALICACVCFVVNPKSSDPCTRFFHDIQPQNFENIWIKRGTGTPFEDDYIDINDAKQRKKLAKLFHTFREEDFADGEPVNENAFDYKIYIDMDLSEESLTNFLVLGREEEADADIYCISGENEDTRISGKRIHSPKLTELLKEYEETNLHISYWAEAQNAGSITAHIKNTEYDNPAPHLTYKENFRVERYTGKKDPYTDKNSWETVPELKDGKNTGAGGTAKGNEHLAATIDITPKYGELPEGIYRLILPFTQKLQNGKTIEQEKSAVFEWVENRLHFVDWDFLLSQPDGDLNEETKDDLNKIFKNGNKNTLYDYFTSAYSSPDKMDFVEFLKYYPAFDDNHVWTAEMKEMFENSEYWSPYRKDGWTLDNYPEGPSFYDPAKINESLAYYAGITTDDIRANYTEKKWKTFYVKEIDRYVVFGDGWTTAEFIVEEGKKSGDTVTLTGETIMFKPLKSGEMREFGTSVLILKEKDGRYLIQSLQAK